MPDDPNTDPCKPPAIPTEVFCLHCQQQYDSYLLEWRVEVGADGQERGFWCCPTPGCGGCGFGCDIFPTDPEYVDENGQRMWHDDEEPDDDSEEVEGFEDRPPSNGVNGTAHPPAPDGESDIPW